MFQAITKGYIGVNNLDLNHRIWQIIRRMWRHNRLDAQLQVRDCSVSEPKTEYIGNINHPQRLLTDYVNFSLKS